MIRLLSYALIILAAKAIQVPMMHTLGHKTIDSYKSLSESSTGPSPMELNVLKPNVFIVSMFEPEEKVWTSRLQFPHTVYIPGLPQVRCTEKYQMCQFTTGEGEINAAASMAFLLSSPRFDFSQTYWLLAGIGGGEPSQVTSGSVTFARFAIQVGLLFEIDSRELSNDYVEWPYGHFAFGTKHPWTYPKAIYGTELFELNENLRNHIAKIAALKEDEFERGDPENIALRELYIETAARELPAVKTCDVTTSDGYYTGEALAKYVADYSKLVTNGTAVYCVSAQEENATLEALLRIAAHGSADFLRIIVMRSVSNFIRGPPGMDPLHFLLHYPKGGIQHALDNLYIAGWPIVQDILDKWESEYRDGKYAPTNYIGDIVGRMGQKPPYGREKYGVH